MKKSIFVLLVLLAVLIVTCVYQKTYEIYSTSPQELTLIERTSKTPSTATTAVVEKKEEKASTVALAPIAIKPVAVKPVPAVKAEPKMKVVSENKPAVKTEKTVDKEVKEEAAASIKNRTSAPKEPTVMIEDESAPKPVITEKSPTENTNMPVSTAEKSGEKEIVDYVMWALKNRDIAMKNRDQVEARIHELITKALNDRKIVLDERSKNEVELQKLQTEQIDARDASYESVINPKITKQGEK